MKIQFKDYKIKKIALALILLFSQDLDFMKSFQAVLVQQ